MPLRLRARGRLSCSNNHHIGWASPRELGGSGGGSWMFLLSACAVRRRTAVDRARPPRLEAATSRPRRRARGGGSPSATVMTCAVLTGGGAARTSCSPAARRASRACSAPCGCARAPSQAEAASSAPTVHSTVRVGSKARSSCARSVPLSCRCRCCSRHRRRIHGCESCRMSSSNTSEAGRGALSVRPPQNVASCCFSDCGTSSGGGLAKHTRTVPIIESASASSSLRRAKGTPQR
mmetsp:Transcript_25872/g.77056  ORF Transcript_25872/g.77056 Transcript_25872/m.77056 type:complete len:236 (+) Transcript_25872:831-1538(+)